MSEKHLSDHDLERYYLGLIKDEPYVKERRERVAALVAAADQHRKETLAIVLGRM